MPILDNFKQVEEGAKASPNLQDVSHLLVSHYLNIIQKGNIKP